MKYLRLFLSFSVSICTAILGWSILYDSKIMLGGIILMSSASSLTFNFIEIIDSIRNK